MGSPGTSPKSEGKKAKAREEASVLQGLSSGLELVEHQHPSLEADFPNDGAVALAVPLMLAVVKDRLHFLQAWPCPNPRLQPQPQHPP